MLVYGDAQSLVMACKVQFSFREKLERLLNISVGQLVVVTLIILDLLIVTVLVLLEQRVIVDPKTSLNINASVSVKTTQKVFHIVQLGILALYIVEMFLRVIASGRSIIYDKWQLFDFGVVVLTVTLYVTFAAALGMVIVTFAVGYIILLRLWRFKRLYQSIVLPAQYKQEEKISNYIKKYRQAEDNLKAVDAELQAKMSDILLLRQKVATLKAKLSHGDHSNVDVEGPDMQIGGDGHRVGTNAPYVFIDTASSTSKEGNHSASAPCTPVMSSYPAITKGQVALLNWHNRLLATNDSRMHTSDIQNTMCLPINGGLHVRRSSSISLPDILVHTKNESAPGSTEDLTETHNSANTSQHKSPTVIKQTRLSRLKQANNQSYESCQSLPNLDNSIGKQGMDVQESSSEKALNELSRKEHAFTGQHGVSNLAYTPSMTEEEFREIQRISKLPYIVNAEGIPMTDL